MPLKPPVPAAASQAVRVLVRQAVSPATLVRPPVSQSARALVSQAVRLAILARAPARPAVSPVMSATTASPGAR